MRVASDPLRKVLDRGDVLAMGTVTMRRIRSMAQGVNVPHCTVSNEVEGFPNEKLAAHPVELAQLFGSFFQQATCKHVMNSLHGPAHFELSALLPDYAVAEGEGLGSNAPVAPLCCIKILLFHKLFLHFLSTTSVHHHLKIFRIWLFPACPVPIVEERKLAMPLLFRVLRL